MMKILLIILFCVFSCYGQETTIDQLGTNSLSGIVGLWHCNEALWNGTAGEVKDASGNGHHGVRLDGATTTPGRFSNCGIYDGIDDRVDLGDHADFTVSSGFTIMAWIKVTGAAGNGAGNILAKWSAAGGEYYFRVADTIPGAFETFIFVYDQTTAKYIARADNVNAIDWSNGSWHLATATWNGGVTTASLKIYADGVRIDDTDDTNGNITAMRDTAYNLEIGENRPGIGEFNGLIEEVVLLNRELSVKEIKDIYRGLTE